MTAIATWGPAALSVALLVAAGVLVLLALFAPWWARAAALAWVVFP